MKIIGDPGSCHMGKYDKAMELIQAGADCGLDGVKFQLLTPSQCLNGNVRLDWDWMPDLMDLGDRLGIEVFASVFNLDGARWMEKCGARSIKFSYGSTGLLNDSRIRDIAADTENVYVSLDIMKSRPPLNDYISLYCIPEYPVRYTVDFEGLFPMFDGFSSHCLGIEQDLRAIAHGAKYLEKHFTLDREDISCPDHQFALRPKQLAELCSRAVSRLAS